MVKIKARAMSGTRTMMISGASLWLGDDRLAWCAIVRTPAEKAFESFRIPRCEMRIEGVNGADVVAADDDDVACVDSHGASADNELVSVKR